MIDNKYKELLDKYLILCDKYRNACNEIEYLNESLHNLLGNSDN